MSKGGIWLIVLASLLLALPGPTPVSAGPLRQGNLYVVNAREDVPDADPGDGECQTASWLTTCTLRAAIEEANADGVPSTINFAQPFTGQNYISGCLPTLTAPETTIDAGNQWDTTHDRPGVEILGIGCPNLLLSSQKNVVRGILFGSSGNGQGILLWGDHNTIGGAAPGQRNVFISDTGILALMGDYTAIIGNYFGTIDGQDAVASKTGIVLATSNNRVENNLIVGHSAYGIEVTSHSDNNVIKDNIIGLDASMNTALPNNTGLYLRLAGKNTIEGNVIAGNTGLGLKLEESNDNLITGNQFGRYWSNIGNGSNGLHLSSSDGNKIKGTMIWGNDGYGAYIDGDNNTITGMAIGHNNLAGVYIARGMNNQIGGAGDSGNEITGNKGSGVQLGAGATNTIVAGNYIGLDLGAYEAGNDGYGVLIEAGAGSNRIGGLGQGEGNWIGYNGQSGIYLTGPTTQFNIVEGNVIGAPVTWQWQAPNGHHGIGLYNGAHHNQIGPGNTIVANNWSGIAIFNSNDNTVSLNNIGVNDQGANWGNRYCGVALVQSAANLIFGNKIAYNGTPTGSAGVRVEGGLAGNPLSANLIHDNAGPGIELIKGGNFGLGPPIISQVECLDPAQTLVEVRGTGCPGCTIEIFSDTADEGGIYHGNTLADAQNGAFLWSGSLQGPHVTATATMPAGVTSAFSAPFNVSSCRLITLFLPVVMK